MNKEKVPNQERVVASQTPSEEFEPFDPEKAKQRAAEKRAELEGGEIFKDILMKQKL